MLLASSFLLHLSACGNSATTSEDYGDLMASPSGLTLVESEHVYGWGKSDCTLCHHLNNIHLNQSASGYNESGLVYMPDVRDIVSSDGISSCSTCHGTNGVQ